MAEIATGSVQVSSDLPFLTNEPGKSLRDRFGVLLRKDTRCFDCLVGYFFISGFHRLYPALEKVEKVRILVGLKTDQSAYQLLEEARERGELEKSADSENIETGVQKFVEWIRSGKLEIKAHPAENLQRHEHLPAALLCSAHILAHDAVAAREPMLFSEPVEDPLGGVSLITRRHRIQQHLPHHVPRDAEIPRYRPLTSSLHQYRTSYTPVNLHPVHPSGIPWIRLPQQPCPQNQDPAVAYFFTATALRSRGALWPIFAVIISAS